MKNARQMKYLRCIIRLSTDDNFLGVCRSSYSQDLMTYSHQNDHRVLFINFASSSLIGYMKISQTTFGFLALMTVFLLTSCNRGVGCPSDFSILAALQAIWPF